jgi:hypothetical protein
MTHISTPSEQELRARIEHSFGELRSALRQYFLATGQSARFILEKEAPEIRADALKACRVYASRHRMLDELPRGGVIAEVGTQYGNWARSIIDVCNPTSLHLFDRNFTLLRKDVAENPLVLQHHGDSSHELSKCADGMFDWIYIDGDHSYRGVTRDIQESVRKVKHDGMLVLNDYIQWSPFEAIPYGIVAATNELINSGEWEMVAIALTPSGYWDVVLKRS